MHIDDFGKVRQLTVAEAEAMLLRPSGGLNEQWKDLKGTMQEGDELWTFSSGRDSWEKLAGTAGVALVRDSQVVRVIVTMMN